MEIRMADAAVGDRNPHIMRPWHSPADIHGLERLIARVGAVGFDGHDLDSCVERKIEHV
jgi:hypothetical protein